MSRLIRARASVAVVGSSGNLLFHGHGNEIDRHDVVIRVNGAVIQGYQKDVGSRTDVLVAWSRGVDEARRSKQLYKNLTVVYTCTDYFPDDCHWTDAEEYEGVRHALVLSNEWVHWVHQNTMGKAGNWPSTGFATMILAMTLAKASGAQPPTVYGFGACLNCTKYCDCDGSNSTDADRAFDELGEKKAIDGASWHAFGTEAELRRRFAADNLIQLRPTVRYRYCKAYKRACEHGSARKYFEHAGALMTANGSDDHLIKLEGGPTGKKYTF